jgi:hypothetical protein
MFSHANISVLGMFEVANVVDQQSEGTFDAVFIISSQLGLACAQFYGFMRRLFQALRPDGLRIIG